MTRLYRESELAVIACRPHGGRQGGFELETGAFEIVLKSTGEILAGGRGFVNPRYQALATALAMGRLTGAKA